MDGNRCDAYRFDHYQDLFYHAQQRCDFDTVYTTLVNTVSLDTTALDLTVGDTQTLTATITPDDANNKNVSWSSDKPSVATVDENGKVTAVAAGTANITVKTVDGEKTAVCTVTVTAKSSGGSSSGSSSAPTYPVTAPSKTENGSITVSPKNAKKGTTVNPIFPGSVPSVPHPSGQMRFHEY